MYQSFFFAKNKIIFSDFSFRLWLLSHRKIQKQTTSEKLLTLILRSFFILQNFFLVDVYFCKISFNSIYHQLFLCTSAPAQKGNRKIGGIYQMEKRDFSILKETISPQNVQVMSELITIQEIKFLIGHIGAPMITMRNNLLKDLYYKSEPNYQISDSYDLVQECALFLCEHFGKKLSDVHHIDKKGRKITIELQAIRKMIKPINRQSRSARKEISLDVLLEKNTPIVEIPIEDNNDYTKVDGIIESLNLNETQKLALECRMNGMSYPEIASVIGRAISTSYDMLKFIQKKYLAMNVLGE